uniref:Protein sleepless n=1 Tax=Clastoptera arizonana TaxID=38151 RepID=A0A1B6E5E3_9HEMI
MNNSIRFSIFILSLIFLLKLAYTREADGTLRCYQCETDDADNVCSLRQWENNDNEEKRKIMMSCRRRMSSFCKMVTDPYSDYTLRGCAGKNYTSGKEAHIGCIYIEGNKRLCLCDSNFCNTSVKIVPNLVPIIATIAYVIL